jgi:hypothetical protein
MKNDDEDFYAQLAPGIRATVRLLRREGYETTDSGDGTTNIQAGMECAMDVPMIAIEVERAEQLPGVTRELHKLLIDHGIQEKPDKWSIQGTYSPVDKKSIITVWGIKDIDFPDVRIQKPTRPNEQVRMIFKE